MTDAPPRDCVLHLSGLDTDVRVEFVGSGAADLLATARRAWSRCLAAPSDQAVRLLVHAGEASDPEERAQPGADQSTHLPATPDLAGTDADELMDRLSPLITLAAIQSQAGLLLMLHAAAIADPVTGRALALVGPSGAGKTTATRVLARQWGYLTDETVGVRPDGTIASYPKPLSIKLDASLYKEQHSSDDLGLASTPATTHLHRVVLLERDDSPAPWLEEISTVQALALLAPETSSLSRLERPLHQLAELLGAAGLRRLRYQEAEQLPALVEQILGED